MMRRVLVDVLAQMTHNYLQWKGKAASSPNPTASPENAPTAEAGRTDSLSQPQSVSNATIGDGNG